MKSLSPGGLPLTVLKPAFIANLNVMATVPRPDLIGGEARIANLSKHCVGVHFIV
jgi:hypothetical protein